VAVGKGYGYLKTKQHLLIVRRYFAFGTRNFVLAMLTNEDHLLLSFQNKG